MVVILLLHYHIYSFAYDPLYGIRFPNAGKYVIMQGVLARGTFY